MEPYTYNEIAWMRDMAKRVPVTDGSIERWLATVDALQTRLAAAEAAVAVRDTRIMQLEGLLRGYAGAKEAPRG